MSTAHERPYTPPWFAEIAKKSEPEQAAAILGVLAAREIAPVRNIVLRCDNGGAFSAIIRGSCETRLGRQLASVFWATIAKIRWPYLVGFCAIGLEFGGPSAEGVRSAP